MRAEDNCVLHEDPAHCRCITEHSNTINVLGSALCPIIRRTLSIEDNEMVQVNPPQVNPTSTGPQAPLLRLTQPGGVRSPGSKGGDPLT